jgi:hypothetical protein
MSSAFYPLGFKSYNNHVHQGGYKSWKGKGPFSLPVGMTATHIRPLTNKDPGNCFSPGFGLPRPLRHYRRGTVPRVEGYEELLQTSPEIAYNLNRAVKSSNGSSLGGKNGGLMAHLMDSPGGYVVKNNSITSPEMVTDCVQCHGIAIIDNTLPIPSLTETPEPNVETKELCCNEQRKAERMARPVKTMLSKKYYQTTYAKLYNRCKTFQQNQFNYKIGADPGVSALFNEHPNIARRLLLQIKPGSPLATKFEYIYAGQCNPNFVVEKAYIENVLSGLSQELYQANKITYDQLTTLTKIDSVEVYINILSTMLPYDQYSELVNILYASASVLTDYGEDCARVSYKPNNYKYAKQGAVSSSSRILQLNVETINKNLSQMEKGFNYKYNICNNNCGNI